MVFWKTSDELGKKYILTLWKNVYLDISNTIFSYISIHYYMTESAVYVVQNKMTPEWNFWNSTLRNSRRDSVTRFSSSVFCIKSFLGAPELYFKRILDLFWEMTEVLNKIIFSLCGVQRGEIFHLYSRYDAEKYHTTEKIKLLWENPITVKFSPFAT